MRIVHVLNELVDTGNGIVNATVDLACAQSREGHQVSIISAGGGYVPLLERHNIRHYAVNLRPRSPIAVLRDIPRLKQILRDLKPNIVHVHMMTGAILLWAGRMFAGFGNYGLVTTIHNEWRFASHLMRVGDRIIVLSEHGRSTFRTRGFPDEKLRVVSHGILGSSRRSDEVAAADYSLPPNSPVILTVAGLYARKGIGDLIRAFGQVAGEFPEASLVVAGWGPDQKLFEQLRASVAGGDRIFFLGFVAKPRRLMKQADIFVLASHTESFPLALAEAREAECAVIGTRVGGVPELLENGRAGVLIPAHDAGALAQSLRTLLSEPQKLARQKQASQFNIDWLSCARMEKDTSAVYRALLDERNLARDVGSAPRSTSSAPLASIRPRLRQTISGHWRSRQ